MEGLVERGDELLRDGDVDAAQAAYSEAEAAGQVLGTLRLAALLEDHRQDLVGAEAAYGRADAAGDVNGSGNLGRLLRDRGELEVAEAAFRRCVDRGSLRAIGDLAGVVLQRGVASSDQVAAVVELMCRAQDALVVHGSLEGSAAVMLIDTMEERYPAAFAFGVARADEGGSAAGGWHVAWGHWRAGRQADAAAAFRRSADRGYDDALGYLAACLQEIGDLDGAESAARDGDTKGIGGASYVLGCLLDAKGDRDGALAAYLRADDKGDANGAFNLGIELMERNDLQGSEAALRRALERGAPNAEHALAEVDRRRSLIR